MGDNYIIVQSAGKQKQSLHGTTRVGLKNLGAQYKLLARKNIEVEDLGNTFIVRLPLIHSAKN